MRLAQIFRVGVDYLCQHGRLFCWVQPVPEPDRGRQDPQRAGRHQRRGLYGHESHRGMQDPPAGTFCSCAGRLPAGIYGCGHASCQHRHRLSGWEQLAAQEYGIEVTLPISSLCPPLRRPYGSCSMIRTISLSVSRIPSRPSSPTLRMVFSTPFVTMPSPLRNCWPFLYM